MITKNIDVRLLGRTILLFRDEVLKSASSGVFNVDAYDMARLESYIARLEKDLAHVISQPKLDLPKSHPNVIPMEDLPTDYNLDSPAVEYVLRIFDAGYFELVNSQSSDLSNGLEVADSGRVSKLLERLKGWVATLKQTQEIDAPEQANVNSPK